MVGEDIAEIMERTNANIGIIKYISEYRRFKQEIGKTCIYNSAKLVIFQNDEPKNKFLVNCFSAVGSQNA